MKQLFIIDLLLIAWGLVMGFSFGVSVGRMLDRQLEAWLKHIKSKYAA